MATLNVTGVIVDNPQSAVTTTTRVDHTPANINFAGVLVDSPTALVTSSIRVDHTVSGFSTSNLYSVPFINPVLLRVTSNKADHPDTSIKTVRSDVLNVPIVTAGLLRVTSNKADHPDTSIKTIRSDNLKVFPAATTAGTTAGSSFYW